MIMRSGGAFGQRRYRFVNGDWGDTGRRRFAYAFMLAFSAQCLFALGCGTGFLRLRSDDSDIPDPDLDRDTLPAEVIDAVPPEYEGYDIVAVTLDKDSNLWDFRVKARQGVNNNLTFEWEFGDGQVYTGIDQSFAFADSGNQLVTVTAREANGKIAFVLSLHVEILAGNQPPVSDAGADQTANENQLVFLYGGGSFDPDDSNLSYRWSQLSGPPVQLLDQASPTARFVTPFVDSDTNLDFDLTVDDGELVGKDAAGVTVIDTITPAETGPTADAGPDQQVSVGDLVTLNADASVGAPGMTYLWSQTAGPTAVLANENASSTTFVAPSVAGASEQLVFELIVTEGDLSDVDEVAVTVASPGAQSCDLDTDGDGTPDCNDLCPSDTSKTTPGLCGCGTPDTDSDGDGVPDCTDQCPDEIDADADGDGRVNCLDNCPNDPGKMEPGVCGCGIADADSNGNGILDCAEQCPPGTGGDDDGDGVANCLDECPSDAAKTAPLQCGCGVTEADSDGDSVPDCMDVCPGEPDVDADADGVMNCDDECPSDPTKTQVGICGCGVADLDTDGDGTMDCEDNCPADADKLEPGECGCGLADTDANGNGVADCNESAGSDALSEDFSGYPAGADPASWLDTGTGNSMFEDDSLFTVLTIGGNPALATSSTNANIHSHYVGVGSDTWRSYEFSGRWMMTSAAGGAGVTFLSDYPNSDSYYRLRFYSGASVHIAPHPDGSVTMTAGTTDTGVFPVANVWYRFRIEVEADEVRTNVRAKVWADNTAEPASWQVDAYDEHATRHTAGTVGLWSMGSGSKYWDDLMVRTLSCDTDGDGDGTLDCDDGCPNDPAKTVAGTCGCGVSELDSDRDGVADCVDQCPGQFDADSDNDGVADCVDACPGFDDALDSNGNGIPNGCEPPALGISTTSLNLGTSASSASFRVWNSGGGSLSYTVTDDASWLSVLPNGGTSTGEEDSITATVNRSGLVDGTYDGEITVTPSAGTAVSILVSMTVGASAGPNVSLVPARTSGVSPLGVFFDSTATTSGATARPFHELDYSWDFGDYWNFTYPSSPQPCHPVLAPSPSCESRARFENRPGVDANRANGGVAAHVFELPPGVPSRVYTVTLTVTDGLGNSTEQQREITVNAFSGTTYYVSNTRGSDSNSGLTPQAPLKSFSKALDMENTNVRILFRRTENWTISGEKVLRSAGPGILGAYYNDDGTDDRTKAKPKITQTITSANAIRLSGNRIVKNWRIMDLWLQGPGNGTDGDAINATGSAVLVQLLELRVNAHGFQTALINTGGYSTGHDQNLIVDCDLSNNGYSTGGGLVYLGGSRTAFLGNIISNVALSGEHCLRVWYMKKGIISENSIRDPGFGKHALKLHATLGDVGASEYIVVSGNTFRGHKWPVTIGPESSHNDQRVRQVLFSRNTIEPMAVSTVGLVVNARDVTIRNNVFLGTAAFPAVHIFRRGECAVECEPEPARVHVYNNSAYTSAAAYQYRFINVGGNYADIVIRNNLASAPNATSPQMIRGTPTQADHNLLTMQPGYAAPDNGELSLTAGSPAIDAGVDLPIVRNDIRGIPRPQGAAHDIGAFERVP